MKNLRLHNEQPQHELRTRGGNWYGDISDIIWK